MAQFPTNGTPLYDVTPKAYAAMLETYDPSKINAVVFLTDGVNDDGNLGDDDDQFDAAHRPRCSRAARAPPRGRCACSRSPTAKAPTR